MAGDLEQLLHVEMLRDLGLSCLEKRRLRGDPIECMGDTWIGPGSFQQRPVTARSNWHKQEHRKFHTNMRKNFLTLRVTEHWNRLPDRSWSLLLWQYSKHIWVFSSTTHPRGLSLAGMISRGLLQAQQFYKSSYLVPTPGNSNKTTVCFLTALWAPEFLQLSVQHKVYRDTWS